MDKSIRNQHHVLYRAFDKEKKLLYVGISNSFYDRLRSHQAQSEWAEKADYITFEHFYSREEVLSAEKSAIETELPMYNKAHNPLYEQPKKHWATITSAFATLDSHHEQLLNNTKAVYKHLWSYRDLLNDEKPERVAAMAFHFVFWETYSSEEPSSPCLSCNNMVEDTFFYEMVEEAEVSFAFRDSQNDINYDLIMSEAAKLLEVSS